MDGKGAVGNGATFDIHNNYIAKVQLINASLVMCVENNRVCVQNGGEREKGKPIKSALELELVKVDQTIKMLSLD